MAHTTCYLFNMLINKVWDSYRRAMWPVVPMPKLTKRAIPTSKNTPTIWNSKWTKKKKKSNPIFNENKNWGFQNYITPPRKIHQRNKPETNPEWLHPAETWVIKLFSNELTTFGHKLLTMSPWPSWPDVPLPQVSTFPPTKGSEKKNPMNHLFKNKIKEIINKSSGAEY